MIFTTLGSAGKNLVLILLERRRKYGRQCDASTLGPSIVALCLRAGWKLGGVTEMYHFRLDAGDLNVVRRAACLDIETKYYGYRPYFNCSDLDQNGKLAAMAMAKADRWLKEHIPKFCRSQNNSNRQMIILCRSTL